MSDFIGCSERVCRQRHWQIDALALVKGHVRERIGGKYNVSVISLVFFAQNYIRKIVSLCITGVARLASSNLKDIEK